MWARFVVFFIFSFYTYQVFAVRIPVGVFQDYLEVWRYSSFVDGEWHHKTLILNQEVEILKIDIYKSTFTGEGENIQENKSLRRKLKTVSILPRSFAIIDSYIEKKGRKKDNVYLSFMEGGDKLIGLLPITDGGIPPAELRYSENFYYSNEALNGEQLPFWYRISPFGSRTDAGETVMCYQDAKVMKELKPKYPRGTYRLVLYPNSNVASYGVDWTSSNVRLVEGEKTVHLDLDYNVSSKAEELNAHLLQLNLVAVSQPIRPYITFPILLELYSSNDHALSEDSQELKGMVEQSWIRIPIRFR